jgi:hypothetical protein
VKFGQVSKSKGRRTAMTVTNDISREARERFRSAAALSLEDAMQQRLQYHLVRLTVVGLSNEEVKDLGELGRLSFQGFAGDVPEQVTKIKQRPSTSPLAFALADILEQAASGSNASFSLKTVMLGAVLGAYAALAGIATDDQAAVAVVGAVAGAVAASTSPIVLDNINQLGSREYSSIQD